MAHGLHRRRQLERLAKPLHQERLRRVPAAHRWPSTVRHEIHSYPDCRRRRSSSRRSSAMSAAFSWRPGRSRNSRAAGIEATFVQDNQCRSAQWILRGTAPADRAYAGQAGARHAPGSVFDAVVDLRRSSPTFGSWWGSELSEREQRMLWVPPGLAHGILVTLRRADFLYKCTDFYSPAHERTLAWDDPTVAIAWPLPPGVAPEPVAQGPSRQELLRHREIPVKVLVLGGGGQVARRGRGDRAGGHRVVDPGAARELDIGDAAAIAAHGLGTAPRLDRQCGRLYGGRSRRGRGRPGRPRSMTPRSGILARAAAAARHAGCCIFPRISSSTARPIAPICPRDATNPLERLWHARKLGGERQVLRGRRPASCCAPPGSMPRRAQFRADDAAADARKRAAARGRGPDRHADWAARHRARDLGPDRRAAPARALSLDRPRRRQLVRLRGRDPGGGAARGLLARAVPVMPIATADYPTPAAAPAFSVLDTRLDAGAVRRPGASLAPQPEDDAR